MDAPLITLDDAANTTDVYAFVSQRCGVKYLTTALAVYPHEEPGIGPNKYNFDDDVLYEIRVATGDDVARRAARPTPISSSSTRRYRNRNTILQSYLGVIGNVGDAAQNLIQRYTVDQGRLPHRHDRRALGRGIVPPNNQGNATPNYNRNDDGEQPAKDGVADEDDLDVYTAQSIADLEDGYMALRRPARRRLLCRHPGDLRSPEAARRRQGRGLAGRLQRPHHGAQHPGRRARRRPADRRRLRDHQPPARQDPRRPSATPTLGDFVQVARQGNPLFNEGLVAIKDKDLYSRTSPEVDAALFRKYAVKPELADADQRARARRERGADDEPHRHRGHLHPRSDQGRPLDRAGAAGRRRRRRIRPIPTTPASRASSIFGGDTLVSTVQAGFGNGAVPGGWPNGRRFGDDVVDIAVTALISDLRVSPPIIVGPAGDNVDKNDIAYNKVFPYAATPLNGRTHTH